MTLRDLDVAGVLKIMSGARLTCVEWGGDVHVPAGDLAVARRVHRESADSGVFICSYGSYYRAAATSRGEGQAVLDTAAELGAPRIRVWAGEVPSRLATETVRARVVADLVWLAEQAAERDLTIALEYHGGTLTDERDSAVRLIWEVAAPNVSLYWQPPLNMPDDLAVADASAVLPFASAIHVFSWLPGEARRKLRSREGMWRPVIAAAVAAGITDALLEFVPGDDPGLVAGEAGTLTEWIRRTREYMKQ